MNQLAILFLVAAGIAGVVASCGNDHTCTTPATPDFSTAACDAKPACGDGAVPPFVFPDLAP